MRVPGLELRFLINTEHNCVLRWIEVQPYDIVQLPFESRIVAGA